MFEKIVRYYGRAVGRVQGVGFRFFVQQNAVELGLTGWVRNMDDGSVTMEMQGQEAPVAALETHPAGECLHWCKGTDNGRA